MSSVLTLGSWDRSGSTVIANVLGAVPGVTSVGELNNLWDRGVRSNRACGCGQRFADCPFWSEVMDSSFGDRDGQRLVDQVVDISPRLGSLRVVTGQTIGYVSPVGRVYRQALARLYEGIARVSSSVLIVDSSKVPWHLALATTIEGCDVRTLHLIRDPRGVAYSLQKTVAYDTDEELPFDMDKHPAGYVGLAWTYRNLLISLQHGRGAGYLRIRYEDWAETPETTTKSILSFARGPVDPLPFVMSDVAVLPVNHNVSGNPSRFRTGEVTIRSDDEWMRNLSRKDRLAVGATTLALRLRYGYPNSPKRLIGAPKR